MIRAEGCAAAQLRSDLPPFVLCDGRLGWSLDSGFDGDIFARLVVRE